MNVALYARVSMRDGRQDTENQLRELREFAAKQGWIVFHEYIDYATGKNADRVQFRAMMNDASRHKFDVLLFWALDRLTREGALQTLSYLQLLSSYGVAYRSFSEQYLDTCGLFKDAVISILATIARQERARLSERVLAGLARARQQGRIGGRPRVTSTSDVAKARELQASGMSQREIARSLGLSNGTVSNILAARN